MKIHLRHPHHSEGVLHQPRLADLNDVIGVLFTARHQSVLEGGGVLPQGDGHLSGKYSFSLLDIHINSLLYGTSYLDAHFNSFMLCCTGYNSTSTSKVSCCVVHVMSRHPLQQYSAVLYKLCLDIHFKSIVLCYTSYNCSYHFNGIMLCCTSHN